MAGYTIGQDLGTEILSAISKSQAAVVEAIETWATALQAIKPDLPEFGVPFADKLPTAHEVLSGSYDFAANLLASQRKFAEDALAAAEPLLTSGSGAAARQQKAAA